MLPPAICCNWERDSTALSVNWYSIELLTARWLPGTLMIGGAAAIPPNGPPTLGSAVPSNEDVSPPPWPMLVLMTWLNNSSRSPPPSLVQSHWSATLSPAPRLAQAPRPMLSAPMTALLPLTIKMPSPRLNPSDTSRESLTSAPPGTPVLVLVTTIVSVSPSTWKVADAARPLSGFVLAPPASAP